MEIMDLTVDTLQSMIMQVKGANLINLAGYSLDKIPDEIFELDIKYLDVSFNNITRIRELPDTLEYLSARYNKINRYEVEGLKRVIFEGNRIKKIPDIISDTLISLNIANNQLTEFPNIIANLITLDLSNNRIVEVPDSICRLNNLKRLYLGFNRIERLPECMANLSNLQFFTIQSNYLTEIPDGLLRIEKKIHYDLSNNYELKIPKIVQPSVSMINYNDLYRNDMKIEEFSWDKAIVDDDDVIV